MTKYPLTWPTGWKRRADGADQSRLERCAAGAWGL